MRYKAFDWLMVKFIAQEVIFLKTTTFEKQDGVSN